MVRPNRRLAVYTLGFLRNARLRRVLSLAGWNVVAGWKPRSCDAVGVWGRRPVSARGLWAARKFGLPLLNVEDAWLRSVRPGKYGSRPIGLLLDNQGMHYDPSQPSELEALLQDGDLSDPDLLRRASDGLAFIKAHKLSKYNDWSGDPSLPDPGFVLIIDQTPQDAAITHGGVSMDTFNKMLATARSEHPDRDIMIRTHPTAGTTHFQPSELDPRIKISFEPTNPWDLLARAHAVYCVSSQMGFEAILAGHRPVVFGQPFYAGWGLSDDRMPLARRTRTRSLEQLFAAAMLLYPTWYDPCRDQLTDLAGAAMQLAAEARARRENRVGSVCMGMKPWKHSHMVRFLTGQRGKPIFENDPSKAALLAHKTGREVIVWASKETDTLRSMCRVAQVPLRCMEDGFLRSVGLGAQLLPAASLVLDDAGIYFDPTGPSQLERLIAGACDLSAGARMRADALRTRIVEMGLTKYNVGAPVPEFDVQAARRVILVPGQVEDDASIKKGTTDVASNLDLLRRARTAFPTDFIIYKPHPDVEAGLRVGDIPEAQTDQLADIVARDMSASDLIARADIVVTMTSLMGFEALLRGKEVHCLGMPFYGGWGLTQDHGQTIERRSARPDLTALVHATLIDYPRYFDPVSQRPCPPEVILDRLADRVPEVSRNPARRLRWLAALQYRLRRFAYLWRR